MGGAKLFVGEVTIIKLRGRARTKWCDINHKVCRHNQGKLADQLCWYSYYHAVPSDNCFACMHEQSMNHISLK